MTKTNHRVVSTLLAMAMLLNLSVMAAEGPPDLTKGETTGVDRKATYNLGATGMRGWIYLKPATHFDGLQGRTTAVSRQILVTHVGAKSPADGVMQVGDVILGVGGTLFTDDARRSIAVAIQEAEKDSNNSDGMARATLRGYFENRLTVEDVQALAPDILAAVKTPSPADKMFSNEIRMGGFKALAKYNFKESIRK